MNKQSEKKYNSIWQVLNSLNTLEEKYFEQKLFFLYEVQDFYYVAEKLIDGICHTPVQKEIKAHQEQVEQKRMRHKIEMDKILPIHQTSSGEKCTDTKCQANHFHFPSPSSESWDWKKEFEKKFIEIRCNSCGERFTADDVINFIKNTIIPAEVERGRKKTIEECVEFINRLGEQDFIGNTLKGKCPECKYPEVTLKDDDIQAKDTWIFQAIIKYLLDLKK